MIGRKRAAVTGSFAGTGLAMAEAIFDSFREKPLALGSYIAAAVIFGMGPTALALQELKE